MDTGSGSTYSSAGIFTHIQFEHNYVHECYGGTNFRCNSDSYCSLTIYNNTWEDISSTYSDTQWPLKGFEAFHVATINVTANHFRRIDRGMRKKLFLIYLAWILNINSQVPLVTEAA